MKMKLALLGSVGITTAVAVAVAVAVAFAAPPKLPPTPVSHITVSPQPVYEDLASIVVSFTTARAVGSAQTYTVWLKSHHPPNIVTATCSPYFFSTRRIVGGPGKRLRLRIRPLPFHDSGDDFCPGPASVNINISRWPGTRVSGIVVADQLTRDRSVSFRIYRQP